MSVYGGAHITRSDANGRPYILIDSKNPKCVSALGTPAEFGSLGFGGTSTYNNNGCEVTSEGIYFRGQGTNDGLVDGDNILIPEVYNRTLSNASGTTWIVWVKPDDTTKRSLFRGASTLRHIELRCGDDGTAYLRAETHYNNYYLFNNVTFIPGGVPVGQWTMLAFAFADDSGPERRCKFYRNGQHVLTSNDIYGAPTGTSNYVGFGSIGKSTGTVQYNYSPSYKGYMDCITINNWEMSANQIRRNFNGRKARFGL